MGQVPHQCKKSRQDQERMGLGTGTVLGQALGTCALAEMGPLGGGQGAGPLGPISALRT